MATLGFLANVAERDRAALRNLAVGITGIVLFAFVGSPLMDAWDKANAKVENGQKKIAAIQKSVNDALEAKQATDQLRAHATIHETPVTLNRQSAQLLSLVGTLPGYQRLEVARLEPLPLRDEEKYYRSAVSIQFSGSLNDLQRFLTDAGNAKPALKVERLSLTADPKTPNRVSGQVVLAGYAVVVKKAAPAGRRAAS